MAKRQSEVEIDKNAAKAAGAIAGMMIPAAAYADSITAGDTTLTGWRPNEMVQTGSSVQWSDAQSAFNALESIMVRLVSYMLPFLALLFVGLLIWTSLKRLYYIVTGKKHEAEQTKVTEVLLQCFLTFFVIITAFILVEIAVNLALICGNLLSQAV
jgi:hypothetical protein